MPKSNGRNLMLRPDVAQAIKDGKFRIYAVNSIDEGIEVLTGVPAGERGPDGRYPDGSINGRVEKKLRQFSEQLRQFAATTSSTQAASAKSEED
jgi:predicted ATP-dependent protease